jgi:hypothetical protein
VLLVSCSSVASGLVFFFSLCFLFRCVSRLYMTLVVMVVVLSSLYGSVGSSFLGLLVSPDDEDNGRRSGNTLELKCLMNFSDGCLAVDVVFRSPCMHWCLTGLISDDDMYHANSENMTTSYSYCLRKLESLGSPNTSKPPQVRCNRR